MFCLSASKKTLIEQLNRINEADVKFYDTCEKLLAFAKDSYNMFMNGTVEDKRFITKTVLSNATYYDGKLDVELHPAFDTLFRLSKEYEHQKSTIEPSESVDFTNKKTLPKKCFNNGGNDEARLGLLAVHNFCTPFWFFLRKTALRQVVHRDVTRPHFVRSSHLPKSAELAIYASRHYRHKIKKR